eukprot:CAMPEP_0180310488 /NCGR_PEP_ID=MMETSP0988-20121125/29718_1 /TAXON_ID=697907 /ORGANISM="non described non described, Strain CCMP2293" /LENGTH=59 /DNA_ID=CAMNT_0022294455 /DNA_START=12 /DNA_END=188 /DNA_ORIENTATION=+
MNQSALLDPGWLSTDGGTRGDSWVSEDGELHCSSREPATEPPPPSSVGISEEDESERSR